MERTPLLTFSHLRWDFVYQRPQHLMSRIARRREILFVEEPVAGDGAPRLEIRTVAPGLRICQPVLSAPGPAFGLAQRAPLRSLLADWLQHEGWDAFIAWMFTPMPIALARALGARAIVYDCMDELSAFKGAPPELLESEREVMRFADAVFTGGPSLYRAKRALHPFVRCFPSSVDRDHFAAAARLPDPGDQAPLARPRLGFFGVVDERMDLDILAALAARTDWETVVVGPVVKIDPATLPAGPTLHYLGARDYGQLPAYVAGWDVCLMPFALNEATRFISPTKVLEYMAADRPIVSTPITDVAEPYGDIVYLGEGRDGFLAACERALEATSGERDARRTRERRVLDGTSWDATARRMDEILRYLTVPAQLTESVFAQRATA